ncbi:MAG: ABC transporter transmembrane domain-containing protein, partial [Chitinophagaceae bacterium]
MKSLRVIYKYISKYPALVTFYFTLNLLSSIFSLISLTMLAPFLSLIFGLQENNKLKGSRFSIGKVTDNFYDYLSQLIATDAGKVKALLFICIILLTSILLKNIFLYLSMYVLAPIRNRIINDMRSDMFQKILQLPVGFFNDQRKGDIMSKLTNDL